MITMICFFYFACTSQEFRKKLKLQKNFKNPITYETLEDKTNPQNLQVQVKKEVNNIANLNNFVKEFTSSFRIFDKILKDMSEEYSSLNRSSEIDSSEFKSNIKSRGTNRFTVKNCYNVEPLSIVFLNNYYSNEQKFTSEQFFEIIYLQENSIQKTNISKIKEKQNCYKITEKKRKLNSLKTQATEINNENYNYSSLLQISSLNTFLNMFSDVIKELELQFNKFLLNIVKTEYQIHDVLYCEEFKTFNIYSKTFFTLYDYKNNNTLERISQTAHLLYEFINGLDLSLYSNILLKLNSIFFTEESAGEFFINYELYLLRQIYYLFGLFLSNEESKDFRSFALEFNSLKYQTTKIYKDSFNLHIRAFLINLLSIKRNSLVVPSIINIQSNTENDVNKKFIIKNEMYNTVAFTYTFIKFYSEAIHQPILQDHMKFYIILTSLQIERKRTDLQSLNCLENICLIMPHVLFDLEPFNIKVYLNPNDLFRVLKLDWLEVERQPNYLSCPSLTKIIAKLCELIRSRTV